MSLSPSVHARVSIMGNISPRTHSDCCQRMLAAAKYAHDINGLSGVFVVVNTIGVNAKEAKILVDLVYDKLVQMGYAP